MTRGGAESLVESLSVSVLFSLIPKYGGVCGGESEEEGRYVVREVDYAAENGSPKFPLTTNGPCLQGYRENRQPALASYTPFILRIINGPLNISPSRRYALGRCGFGDKTVKASVDANERFSNAINAGRSDEPSLIATPVIKVPQLHSG